MPEQSIAPASGPAAPSPHPAAAGTVQNDVTVPYASPQQAKAAGGPSGANTAKKLALATYGDHYLGSNGQEVPCTLWGVLEFQATGFLVVMAAMVALWLVARTLARLAGTLQSTADGAQATPSLQPLPLEPQQPATTGGLHPGLTDQQLVVILTAAASEVLNSTVRINKIRPINAGDTNWTAEGRMVLHSHRLK